MTREKSKEIINRIYDKHFGTVKKLAKNEKGQVAIRAREINTDRGLSRDDLMILARGKGIKNFRVLNKQELLAVCKDDVKQEEIDQVVVGAVARWKEGWGNSKKEMIRMYPELRQLRNVTIAGIIACIIAFIIAIGVASGEEIKPPKNLWKGIIGEAVGEGERGMLAVCLVYRNRLEKGMPLGCVALKRRGLDGFIRKQERKYAHIAKKIVREVFSGEAKDITLGATHYENIEVFGKPYWAKKMIVTCKIGSHTFYK